MIYIEEAPWCSMVNHHDSAHREDFPKVSSEIADYERPHKEFAIWQSLSRTQTRQAKKTSETRPRNPGELRTVRPRNPKEPSSPAD